MRRRRWGSHLHRRRFSFTSLRLFSSQTRCQNCVDRPRSASRLTRCAFDSRASHLACARAFASRKTRARVKCSRPNRTIASAISACGDTPIKLACVKRLFVERLGFPTSTPDTVVSGSASPRCVHGTEQSQCGVRPLSRGALMRPEGLLLPKETLKWPRRAEGSTICRVCF